MYGNDGFRADLVAVRFRVMRGFGFGGIVGRGLPYVPEFAIA